MAAHSLRRALCGLSLLSVIYPGLPTAQAANPSVAVGEVNVVAERVAPQRAPELTKALRRALNDEVAQLAEQGVVIRHPLVVSATLTKLSGEQREQRASASASISLALRRADDQVLFAELIGRASAEEAPGNLASASSAALRGAVHGALARLPEAVRRSR